MRDSLTVLAILVIVALTAALVGPRLVDWDGHRALVERELSEAAGTPVAVSGPIGLSLLPKPVIHLGGVAVGDGAGGRPRLRARSLDAELSLAALLRGQVQVVDTVLVGPELLLVQGAEGGFGLGPPPASADRVAFDHLGLRDGTLTLALADGRRLTLGGIDLDAEAASLRGPFKAAGTAGGVPFRLGTGALDPPASGGASGGAPGSARLRVKLHIDGAGARPALDLDGALAARPGGVGPGFDGAAVAVGRVALEGTPAAVPWRATARISADRDGARAAEVELRAGADLRALIAAGEGTAAYAAGSAPPRAALALHGATLDADALAVSPADSSIAPPDGPELLALLLRGARDGLGPLPVRLDLDAAFDTARLAGRTALRTAATLRLGPEPGAGPGAGLTLSVDGPDAARLTLDGRVEPAPPPAVAGPFGALPAMASSQAPAFRGRAELRSADLRRTAAWLRPAPPGLADGIAAVLPGRSFRAAGAVEVSAAGVAGRDLDLRLDGTALRGAMAYVPATDSAAAAKPGRARLTADLAAEALDLDRLPDLTGAAAASRGLDLDLSLSARAVRLAAPTVPAPGPLAAGGLAVGGLAASGLALHATRSGDDVRLDRLALDLGGARLEASGSRDAAGGRGALHAAAAAVGPLAEALAPLLPAPLAAGLRARSAALSPLLSPLDATLTLEAAADAEGALVPTRLALAGRAGGTTVDARLTPDGPAAASDARAAADRPVALSLRMAAPRGADLLRLFGVTAPGGATAAAPMAAARLSAEARGTLAGGFVGTLDAALGDTAASFAGRAAPAGGAGRLALRSADLGPALALAGLPAPAGPLAGEASGDIAWDGEAARWRGLAARVGDAGASGELSLDLAARRAPGGEPLPTLHGRLAVDRLPAAALAGLALGPADAPTPGATPASARTSAEPSAWSSAPFAPAPAGLPRAELALTVGDMPLRDALHAGGVSLVLRTAPDGVALTDIAGSVAGGGLSGALSLRRDGPGATLVGRLAWRDIRFDGGGLAGRLGGTGELAGSGDSPAALVSSLAGAGTAALSGAALARTNPAAPARVLAAAAARAVQAERGSDAAAPTQPDAEALRRDLGTALDAGPLALEAAAAPAVLAGGVLRIGPLRASAPRDQARPGQGAMPPPAEAGLTLDLRALSAATRAVLRAGPDAGRDGMGVGDGGGAVAVTRSGPLGGDAARAVDPAGLVAALQAAAIARAQDRIDTLEQDIRERAAFNRQLKAAEQRRQMEREAAEAARQAEAARVAAELQARAAAARAAAIAAAGAAAEAQRQAAEAQRQAAEQGRVEAARQRTERDEAEKQRFFERALRAADPPPDAGARGAPVEGPRAPPGRGPRPGGRDPFDLPAPPSIVQERGPTP